ELQVLEATVSTAEHKQTGDSPSADALQVASEPVEQRGSKQVPAHTNRRPDCRVARIANFLFRQRLSGQVASNRPEWTHRERPTERVRPSSGGAPSDFRGAAPEIKRRVDGNDRITPQPIPRCTERMPATRTQPCHNDPPARRLISYECDRLTR